MIFKKVFVAIFLFSSRWVVVAGVRSVRDRQDYFIPAVGLLPPAHHQSNYAAVGLMPPAHHQSNYAAGDVNNSNASNETYFVNRVSKYPGTKIVATNHTAPGSLKAKIKLNSISSIDQTKLPTRSNFDINATNPISSSLSDLEMSLNLIPQSFLDAGRTQLREPKAFMHPQSRGIYNRNSFKVTLTKGRKDRSPMYTIRLPPTHHFYSRAMSYNKTIGTRIPLELVNNGQPSSVYHFTPSNRRPTQYPKTNTISQAKMGKYYHPKPELYRQKAYKYHKKPLKQRKSVKQFEQLTPFHRKKTGMIQARNKLYSKYSSPIRTSSEIESIKFIATSKMNHPSSLISHSLRKIINNSDIVHPVDFMDDSSAENNNVKNAVFRASVEFESATGSNRKYYRASPILRNKGGTRHHPLDKNVDIYDSMDGIKRDNNYNQELQINKKTVKIHSYEIKPDLENHQTVDNYAESRTITDSKSSQINKLSENKSSFIGVPSSTFNVDPLESEAYVNNNSKYSKLYKQSRYSKNQSSQTLKLLSGIINELLTENLYEEKNIHGVRHSYDNYIQQKNKYTKSNLISNEDSRIFTDKNSNCNYLSKSKKDHRKCMSNTKLNSLRLLKNSPIININTFSRRKILPRSNAPLKKYRFAESMNTIDTTDSPIYYIKPFRH